MTNATENRAKEQARAQMAGIVTMVQRLEHAQQCDGGEEEDQAREALLRNALSPIEVRPAREGWYFLGQDGGGSPAEYKFGLYTGGLAARVSGELDEDGGPKTAVLQLQDWFGPWENYRGLTDEEYDALLVYAREFYFGGI